MIRLYTTLYPEPKESRKAELSKCFDLNIRCPAIDTICILSEGGDELLPVSAKITVIPVSSRPTYADYFRAIGTTSGADDISIIANSDIFFDDQLGFLRYWDFPSGVVFALSRWDVVNRGAPVLYDHNDSQDVWIFRGIPKNVHGDFFVGVPRCDNRIAAEFELAGYRVLNPSFSLRSYHLHEGERRLYLDTEYSSVIPPPYKYVWPHNLFDFWTTLMHNIMHRNARLCWRFDKRKFSAWFPVRALRKCRQLLVGGTDAEN